MISEMICPVCGKKLVVDVVGDNYFCNNQDCEMFHASIAQNQWQALIQIRKDLDLVRDALICVRNNDEAGEWWDYINNILAQTSCQKKDGENV